MSPPPPRRITRFTVMATLQAARAKRLGLSEGSALSWGLNRAIFYAAAKRGFRAGGGHPSEGDTRAPPEESTTYHLGDELAYRDPGAPGLYFTIGGETQTEEEFRRQVAARFGGEKQFRRAWKEALDIVGEFDRTTLESGRQFYATVYRPRRDDLVARWTEEFIGAPRP